MLDLGGKKFEELTPEDIINIFKKMGLTITLDEAKEYKDSTGTYGKIFNQDKSSDIDLDELDKKNKPLYLDFRTLEEYDDKKREELEANFLKNVKHMPQLIVLRNKMQPLPEDEECKEILKRAFTIVELPSKKKIGLKV